MIDWGRAPLCDVIYKKNMYFLLFYFKVAKTRVIFSTLGTFANTRYCDARVREYTIFSKEIKLAFPQSSPILFLIRLPKDMVLRYDWLKMTKRRILGQTAFGTKGLISAGFNQSCCRERAAHLIS